MKRIFRPQVTNGRSAKPIPKRSNSKREINPDPSKPRTIISQKRITVKRIDLANG